MPTVRAPPRMNMKPNPGLMPKQVTVNVLKTRFQPLSLRQPRRRGDDEFQTVTKPVLQREKKRFEVERTQEILHDNG